MAYYGEKIRTGDISHFRAPYKDYTSLGADLPPYSSKINEEFKANLWWINDSSFAAYLKTAMLYPSSDLGIKSGMLDASVTVFGIADTGGQNASPNASDIIEYMSGQGYAAIFYSPGESAGSFIAFTQAPNTIAALCGATSPKGSIVQMPFELGLLASGAAAGSQAPSSSTSQVSITVNTLPADAKPVNNITDAKPGVLRQIGPVGWTVIALGAAGVAYHIYKKRRRRLT